MSTHESNNWRQGVIYTVRPEILAPLEHGREYRILVAVRRIRKQSYGELYRRVKAITDARVAALDCPETPARWIEWHGWGTVEFGDRQFVFSFVGTVVKPGGPALCGERPPTEEELALPRGVRSDRPRIDEYYNDFDHRAPGEAVDEILFSYGEYVSSSAEVDFEPFVRKTEAMARYHYGPELRVTRHDCFCATHPNVAVVHVFFTCGCDNLAR